MAVSIQTQSLHQSGWQSMVMIIAGGLDMRVIRVDTQRHRTGQSFIVPATICVIGFCCTRLKRYTVYADAKFTSAQRSYLCIGLWIKCNAKLVVLLANGIGVARIGETAGAVYRNAIGLNNSLVVLHINANLARSRWVLVGRY